MSPAGWSEGPARLLSRLPVRLKLALVLALPGLALLALAGATVADARHVAANAQAQSELALSTAGPRGLLRNLQVERNHTSAHLLGTEAILQLPPGGLGDARAVVDEALDNFGARTVRTGGQVHRAYRPALSALEDLQDLRSAVDEVEAPGRVANRALANDLFDSYSGLIDQLFAAGERVAVDVDDRELRRGAEIVNLATRQVDTSARLVRALLVAGVGQGGNDLDEASERRTVEELLADLRLRQAALELNATGDYLAPVEELLAHEAVRLLPRQAESALETGAIDVGLVLGWSTPESLGYGELLDTVASELTDEAAASTDRALSLQRSYTVVGLLVIVMVVAVAWLVSCSITRPLRSLAEQAKRVADDDLPRAVTTLLETPVGEDVVMRARPRVEVTSRDEVGEVAEALNIVQGAAVDLAMEQALLRRNVADSLVHLGRRNHDLLVRQLAFITELERHETDEVALASLFRLDHMTTRMRRNAESLLVLAGLELPGVWTTPVKMVDVLRAALGEVDGYQRVVVSPMDAIAVEGSVASSLAHLLAELIENALRFSRLDSAVEVAAWQHRHGYTLVTVADRGAGLDSVELARANRRLAGVESFTVAPSQYLGHYVAGHLAARHGIDVWLESREGSDGVSGTRAMVRLPAVLVFPASGPVNAGRLHPSIPGPQAADAAPPT